MPNELTLYRSPEKALVDLIGALPRCIHNSSKGLSKRCRNLGTHVIELANGEREYGSQICAEHIDWVKKENPGATVLQLRYAEPLIALAKALSIELVCDNPNLSGVKQ